MVGGAVGPSQLPTLLQLCSAVGCGNSATDAWRLVHVEVGNCLVNKVQPLAGIQVYWASSFSATQTSKLKLDLYFKLLCYVAIGARKAWRQYVAYIQFSWRQRIKSYSGSISYRLL